MKKTLKTLLTAFSLTIITMLAWGWWNGVGLTLGKESSIMQGITAISLINGHDFSTLPDDFIFINTSCDLSLVDVYDENGMPRGNASITDRGKLRLLLDEISQSAEYKYIFLDIYLDKRYSTPSDSALIQAVNATPRFVCPYTDSYEISPSKMAMADYRVTALNNSFGKYLITDHNHPSIAYKAYSDLFGTGHATTPGSFIPRLRFNCINKYDAEGNTVIYDLGADLLDTDADINKLLKNKYVFIGAFGSGDIHPTYLGDMDGIQIHANAFADMLDGRHLLSWPVLLITGAVVMALFYLLITLKFYPASTLALSDSFFSKSFLSSVKDIRWLKVLLSFLSFELIFFILFIAVYFTSGRILELTSLSLLFTLLWNIRIDVLKKIYKSIIIMTKSSCRFLLIRLRHFFSYFSAILLTLSSFNETHAEEYKILFISAPGSVIVDGSSRMKGDTITLNKTINWNSPKQAIKLMNLKSGKQSVITSDLSGGKKNLTLASYIHTNRKMAFRDGGINSLESLAAAMPDSIALLDEIKVPCLVPQDSNHYFFITYDYNGETINKKLPIKEGYFYINRDIFIIDGEMKAPFSTYVNIYYRDVNAMRIRIIGEDTYINVYDL